MKKELFIPILFICISLIGFSSALTVQQSAINDIIIKEYSNDAKFLITPFGDSGDYTLYTFADVTLSPSNINITSGKSFELTLTPFDRLLKKDGSYSFYYYLRDKVTEEDTEKVISIKLVSLEDAMQVTIDPISLDSQNAIIHINNKEKTTINDAKIKISSYLFKTVEKEMNIKSGNNDVSIALDFNMLKTIGAGSYEVTLEFEGTRKNVSIKADALFSEKKRIETLDETTGFLARTRSITQKNIGNVAETAEVTITKNIVTRLFTKFNIEPNFVDRKGFFVSYKWVEKLDPQKSMNIQIKTNYSFVVILILLGALLIYGFNKRYSFKVVELKKSVIPIRTKGGEFALKVSLRVKANKSVQEVVLTDHIPRIFKVHEGFAVKPSKIDPITRKVQWVIGDLGKRGERTISYVIYSKVGVIGKFSLPESSVVYKEGHQHKSLFSNKVFFLSDQVSREEDY